MTFIYSSDLNFFKKYDFVAKPILTLVLLSIASLISQLISRYFEKYKLDTNVFSEKENDTVKCGIKARSIDNHQINFELKINKSGDFYYSELHEDKFIEMKHLLNYSESDWELFYSINPDIIPFLTIAFQPLEPGRDFPADGYQGTCVCKDLKEIFSKNVKEIWKLISGIFGLLFLN